MKCSEIMKTNVECCTEDESVERIAERMRDRNVGFVPVCDGNGTLIGTVTDRDLAIRVLAEHRSAGDTTAEQVMSTDPVSCSPDDDLDVAEQKMGTSRKSRIVCVDDDRHPIGVISLSDVVLAESDGKASGLLKNISSREARL